MVRFLLHFQVITHHWSKSGTMEKAACCLTDSCLADFHRPGYYLPNDSAPHSSQGLPHIISHDVFHTVTTGNSSVEAASSQVTLGCINLTKQKQKASTFYLKTELAIHLN